MDEQNFFDLENELNNSRNELLDHLKDIMEKGVPSEFDWMELDNLALYLFEANEEEKLMKVFELADENWPDNPGILYMKGRYLLKKDKMKKLLQLIDYMKSVDYSQYYNDENEAKRFTILLGNNIAMLQGEMAMNRNDMEEAAAQFEKAFECTDNIGSRMFTCMYVARMYDQKEHEEESMKWVKRALLLSPFKPEGMINEMYNMYYDRSEYKDAEDMLDILLDEHPYTTYYWLSKANMHLENGEPEKAIEAIDFALAIEPDHVDAMKVKVCSLLSLHNYQKARELSEEFLGKFPDDKDMLTMLYASLNHLGEKAGDVFQKIMDLELNEPDEMKNKEYMENDGINAGKIIHFLYFYHRLQKEYEDALYFIDLGINLNYDAAYHTAQRGSIFWEQGKIEEAKECFKKALDMADEDEKDSVAFAIAGELFIFKEYEWCQELLLPLYYTQDEDIQTTIYAMLAYCYHEKKEYDKYLYFLKESIEKAPKETNLVMKLLIPEDMPLKDFYNQEFAKYNKDNIEE